MPDLLLASSTVPPYECYARVMARRVGDTMPRVSFKGRGLDPVSGECDVTRGNSVIALSEDSTFDPSRKTGKLVCGCKPHLGATHECRTCECARHGKPCVAVSWSMPLWSGSSASANRLDVRADRCRSLVCTYGIRGSRTGEDRHCRR